LKEDMDKINKEKVELEKLYGASLKSVKEGRIVKGKVVDIVGNKAVVDINYKSEGLIPISEFISPTEEVAVKKGDEVEVYLERREAEDGTIVLSKEKADKLRYWDRIREAYEQSKSIEGKVVQKVKGGLKINIGMEAFLPASQIDLKPPANIETLVGKVLKVRIIKLNQARRNIIVSRRVILEEERLQAKQAFFENLKVGEIRRGIVKNITNYGAFVNLGEIDGLLHLTDISWGRIKKPQDVIKVGQEIEVKILSIDKETKRVSLGLKQKKSDPWLNIEEKYPVGAKVRGRVISLTEYGAFIELEEGVEGLLHVSELSWTKRIKYPSEILRIGEIIETVVLNVNKENKKISLGLKQCVENPWLTVDKKYPIGSVVEGRVKNLVNFGAFVELEEGIEGLIRTSDLSWESRVKKPSEILKVGQKIKAVVLGIEKENEKISLGLKQLTLDPWENVREKYREGDEVSGEVIEVVGNLIIVKIEPGIDGIISKGEVGEEEVAVGKKISALILKINTEKRRLELSIKAYQEAKLKEELKEYASSKPPTLGEVVDKDKIFPKERKEKEKA
jgi:small subunit ribosomal protein S1